MLKGKRKFGKSSGKKTGKTKHGKRKPFKKMSLEEWQKSVGWLSREQWIAQQQASKNEEKYNKMMTKYVNHRMWLRDNPDYFKGAPYKFARHWILDSVIQKEWPTFWEYGQDWVLFTARHPKGTEHNLQQLEDWKEIYEYLKDEGHDYRDREYRDFILGA